MSGEIAQGSTQTFAFGPFLLLPERQLLLKNENAVRIGGRALDILTALVESAGEPLTKHELMSRAWPETVVEPSNLKVNMAALRQALEENPSTPQYIVTIVGTGYKFIAPVKRGQANNQPLGADTASHQTDNLPNSTVRVIGRADAIKGVITDLGTGRLVSIVGPGGVGKTTVALAVAERLRQDFRDGAWFVDLSPLRDQSLVPNAIATSIGYATYSANVLDGLIAFLRNRELLLLVDNCEHLIEGVAASVGRILRDAPGVAMLTTSREPLSISGEQIRDLEGLQSPPLSHAITAEEALSFPAIQLFVDRVADSLETFSLTDTDAPSVAEICRRLDGIALAIELAAARVNIFGIKGLLEQLDDCFRLLTGRRAGPERQRTLAATLGWSYGLLRECDAALLRTLSVFTGDFDLEAAEAVFAQDLGEVENALRELAAKSLLSINAFDQSKTYRLLDTTRAYAFERLRESRESRTALQRHAEYVCTCLERAASEWAVLPASQWGKRYGRFVGDLRAALDWAKCSPGNGALLMRLTEAGSLVWNHFSLMEECRVHVSKAIDALASANLSGTATEMRLQLALAGATMFTRGLIPEVLTALERTTLIATQQRDADHLLRSLRLTSSFQMMRGEHEPAVQTLSSFRSIALLNDRSALIDGEQHMVVAELLLGKLREAHKRIERIRAQGLQNYDEDPRFARFLYDRNAEVDFLRSHIYWLLGRPDTAMQACDASVELARNGRHELSFSNALAWACIVSFWSGDFTRLRRYLSMLDDLIARHNINTWQPLAAFFRSGMECLGESMTPVGLAGLQAAVARFFEIDHLARIPYYVAFQADMLARCDRLPEANASIDRAIDLARDQKEAWCLPEVLRIRGNVLFLNGHHSEAEVVLRESLAMASDIGALSWKLRTACTLAPLLSDMSRTREAHDMLQTIYDEFDEGFLTRDLTIARSLLQSLSSRSP